MKKITYFDESILFPFTMSIIISRNKDFICIRQKELRLNENTKLVPMVFKVIIPSFYLLDELQISVHWRNTLSFPTTPLAHKGNKLWTIFPVTEMGTMTRRSWKRKNPWKCSRTAFWVRNPRLRFFQMEWVGFRAPIGSS